MGHPAGVAGGSGGDQEPADAEDDGVGGPLGEGDLGEGQAGVGEGEEGDDAEGDVGGQPGLVPVQG